MATIVSDVPVTKAIVFIVLRVQASRRTRLRAVLGEVYSAGWATTIALATAAFRLPLRRRRAFHAPQVIQRAPLRKATFISGVPNASAAIVAVLRVQAAADGPVGRDAGQ